MKLIEKLERVAEFILSINPMYYHSSERVRQQQESARDMMERMRREQYSAMYHERETALTAKGKQKMETAIEAMATYSLINIITNDVEARHLSKDKAHETRDQLWSRGVKTELQAELHVDAADAIGMPAPESATFNHQAQEKLAAMEGEARAFADGRLVSSHGVSVTWDAKIEYMVRGTGLAHAKVDRDTAVRMIAASIARDQAAVDIISTPPRDICFATSGQHYECTGEGARLVAAAMGMTLVKRNGSDLVMVKAEDFPHIRVELELRGFKPRVVEGFSDPGKKLPNGAILVDRKGDIVLCVIPGNSATPYATWRIAPDGDTGGGDYHREFSKAVAAYNKRKA
jgi:hypothetical protein